jgi:hypothetical protein
VKLPDTPDTPLPPTEGNDTLQEMVGGFPRHLTTQLIEEGQERRSRRELTGGLLLGLGLAIFALALPQERLIGQQVQHLDPADATLAHIVDLVRGLALRFLGMTPEQPGFVLEALAYGACLPVALAIGRRLGGSFGPTLVGSLVVLLSPVGWLAGTTPGLDALGLLCSLLCLHALWGRARPQALMATSWWVFAAASSPANAWLLPAVVWAGLRGQQKKFELAFSLPCIGVALFLLFSMPVGDLLEVDASLEHLWRAMLFGGSGGWGQVTAWVLGLVPGLGLAVLGVGSLFLLRRNESEGRPPRWLLVWCLLPALAVGIGGSPTWSIPYLWLVPPALVGACDLLARRTDGFGLGWSLGALGVQLGVLSGVLVLLSATDPLEEWRRHARGVLEADDHVATPHREHAYLLANRWGIRCTLIENLDHGRDRLATYDSVDQLGELMLDSATSVGPENWPSLLCQSASRRIAFDSSFPSHSEEYEGLLLKALEEHGDFIVIGRRAAQ